MTKEKKEIRSILLGRTLLTEDGKMTSVGKGDFFLPVGISDGASAVRLLGIARKARVYRSSLSREETLQAAERVMRDLGRALVLREQPETVACFIRYLATRPAVVTFRYLEDRPVLTVWAARGITGRISLQRAISSFERALPAGITRTGEKPPEEPRKPKKEKKAPGRHSRPQGETPAPPGGEPLEEPGETQTPQEGSDE